MILKGELPKNLPPKIKIIPIKDAQQIAIDYAKYYFAKNELDDVYFIVDKNSNTIDKFFTEAHFNIIAHDKNTQETSLKNLFSELNCKIILWYASDYKNLDIFNDHEKFLSHIQDELKNSNYEVYGVFLNKINAI